MAEYTLIDVLGKLRAECRKAKGQASWAGMHDISPSYLCDVLQCRREPGEKILVALGLRKIVRYVVVKGK